ncbi:PLDc N-terminal domain-containing protein [Sphingobacterium lumbrici]|uniref:PLDc N-terminal domain-containing protein n=1 Tax=Sphingobacterium lumbrici TaxID=2559600 RepID=UPI00112EDEEA|nr:PLDc N-terminal domain-containing protein [Sphingobacterium lumbrici]
MNVFINLGSQEIVLLLVLGIVWIIPFALIIYTLIDLFKRDFTNKSMERILIIFLIAFVPILGSLIYLLGLRKEYPLK